MREKRLKLTLCTLIMAGLVGCAGNPAPEVSIKPNPAMMTPPCKLLPPSANADEDLNIDIQNAECTRQLRLRVYQLQDWIRNVTTPL